MGSQTYRKSASWSSEVDLSYQSCRSSVWSYYSDNESSNCERVHIPRPCYYLLIGLGAWKPLNHHFLLKLYETASYLIWLGSMAAIIGLDYLHSNQFRWGAFINTCGTLLNLGCPLIFIKYYFRTSVFDALVLHVINLNEVAKLDVQKVSKIYSLISVVLWGLGFGFFYTHWIPFFYRWWHFVVYGFSLFYTLGWWATWLSLYGFVCHIHKIHIHVFRDHMESCYKQIKEPTREKNEKCVAEMFVRFNIVEDWLHRSQKDFGKIVSFAVGYHIVDMFVFSVAYWHNDFGSDYPIWQYAGGILFDVLSILIKLYPAAVVCQALHNTMNSAGRLCKPDKDNMEIPQARLTFYEFLYMRDQDNGFRILGVKITLKLTVGIFVTIGTAAVTFLRFSMDHLSSL